MCRRQSSLSGSSYAPDLQISVVQGVHTDSNLKQLWHRAAASIEVGTEARD